MTYESDLEARIKVLEEEVGRLKSSILLQSKQFVEFHTHTLGGKVVWEFPPELNKKIMEAYRVALKRSPPKHKKTKMEERLTMSDELEITKTPGTMIKDE